MKATMVICVPLVALAFFWVILRKKNIPPENLFAAAVLCFGLLYMVCITPFSVPDEPHHYNTAYQLSNRLLFRSGDEAVQGNSADFPWDQFDGHNNTLRGYTNGIGQFFAPAEEGETIRFSTPRDLNYFPEYLAPAIGITVARIMNLNFIRTFLLGRFMNLLFFTVCLFFAIRRIPRCKAALGIIALFPMTLQQAASFSYDAFINGLAFVLIASIFRAVWETGPLSLRDMLWIAVSGLLLAPAKVVYTAILLLVFLIPADRFVSAAHDAESRPTRRRLTPETAKVLLRILLPAACAVLALVVSSAAVTDLSGDHTTLNWEGGTNYSLDFVLHHPLKTAVIYFNTLRDRGLWYVCTMVGCSLSGFTLQVPKIIGFLFLLLALIPCLTERIALRSNASCPIPADRQKTAESERSNQLVQPCPPETLPAFPLWKRLYCLVIACMVIAMCMMSMMLGWTSDWRKVIEGVQGRYFLPIAPLLYCPFAGLFSRKNVSSPEIISRFLLLPAIALESFVILYIVNFTLTNVL